MRNIEIKARIQNINDILSKLESLSDTNQKIINQHDTFFNTAKGRLKLRRFEDGTAELIFYERPDVLGPKLCNYNRVILNSETAESLTNILTQSIGVFGIVKKIRQLYMIGQTRIHVDKIDGLGNFIELEVVLEEDQSTEYGLTIANNIMKTLVIKDEDLIAKAYVDLLKETETSM